MRFPDRLYPGYRPPEREEDQLADEVKDDQYWQEVDKQLELWRDEVPFGTPSLEPSYNELELEKQQARRKR